MHGEHRSRWLFSAACVGGTCRGGDGTGGRLPRGRCARLESIGGARAGLFLVLDEQAAARDATTGGDGLSTPLQHGAAERRVRDVERLADVHERARPLAVV